MKKEGCHDRFAAISPVAFAERLLSLSLAAVPGGLFRPQGTILAYHGVVGDTGKSRGFADSVGTGAFERQMRFLRDGSFNVVPLQVLLSYMEAGQAIPEKTVTITFDDGYRDTFTNAFPVLKRYGIPATVFLAAAFIGQKEPFPWLKTLNQDASEATYPMNWEEVRELHDAGVEIGSHTLSHAFLPELDERQILYEVAESQDVIGGEIGESVRSFALPFSFPMVHRAWPAFGDVLAKALLERRFRCCCTMLRGHVTPKDDPFALRRIGVGKFDDMKLFRAKLRGCYAWSRFPQRLHQSFLKKYRPPSV